MSSPVLLAGAPVAERIRSETSRLVEACVASGTTPRLLALLDPSSEGARVYCDMQQRACERVGVGFARHTLPSTTDQAVELLDTVSRDRDVTGVFVHTPVPGGVDLAQLRRHIPPRVDVEGICPSTLGDLVYGDAGFVPSTAEAVVELLNAYDVDLEGRHVVIVGRSPTVGRPLALLLLARRRGPTVTVCHSATRDLPVFTRQADVLVVAAGYAGLVSADMVRADAVVVDVGANFTDDGRMVGDVDFGSVGRGCRAITPVPGGVGPVTVACLVRAVARAARDTIDP